MWVSSRRLRKVEGLLADAGDKALASMLVMTGSRLDRQRAGASRVGGIRGSASREPERASSYLPCTSGIQVGLPVANLSCLLLLQVVLPNLPSSSSEYLFKKEVVLTRRMCAGKSVILWQRK